MMATGPLAAPADGQEPPPNGVCPEDTPTAHFIDRDQARTGHPASIDCVAFHAIALGSIDAAGDPVYLPAGIVNRAQMATFVANTLDAAGHDLPDGDAPDEFADLGATHRVNINALARAEVLAGYPDGTYRPQEPVTRAQMATFIVQAAEWASGDELDASGGPNFADTAGNIHEANIDAGFEAGLYEGRIAPDPTTPRSGEYAPRDGTRRDQMATFLSRLLDHLWELASIAGQVTDASNGDAIPGAVITVSAEPVDPEADPLVVDTNEGGVYLATLDEGSYTVTASADDYQDPEARTGVTVSDNQVAIVNFELEPFAPGPPGPPDPPGPPTEPDSGVILGRVTQANTPASISGATVTVLDDGTEVGQDTADAQGDYSVDVEPGTYTVTAEASGYLPDTEDDVAVAADGSITVNFDLLFDPAFATLTADRDLAPVSEVANPREDALSRGDVNFILTLYDEGDDPINPLGYEYSFLIHNTGPEEVWACVRCADTGSGTDAMVIPGGGVAGVSGVQDINRVRVDAADPTSVTVIATASLVDLEDSTAGTSWIAVDQEPTGQAAAALFSGTVIAFDHELEWYLIDSTTEIVYIEYTGGAVDTYTDDTNELQVHEFQEALDFDRSIRYQKDAEGAQLHWLDYPFAVE